MAVEVVMPRLGWTMETGTVAAWLKKDGDAVQAGEILFTVESDKALQEVEALESGILRLPSSAPGTDVPVGTVLAYIVQPGEAAPFELQAEAAHLSSTEQAVLEAMRPASAEHATAEVARVARGALQTSSAPDGDRSTPAISPRARRVAQELGVAWATISGSGRTGRIVERDVRALAVRSAPAAQARITPLARRIAQQAGVDVEDVAAGMPGKRITQADVAAAASRASKSTGVAAPDSRSRPIGNVRRIIAERMAQSAHTAAPVTLTTEADATELVRLRDHIKAAVANSTNSANSTGSARPVPTYNDILARLVALALLEHPWMNCSLSGDSIVEHHAVHMGLAVDTEVGLLVPVVRDAHRKSVQEIATESARLIEQARAGTAAPDDLRGSTFTITNLGIYDIDAFTPIINPPECAILGVGRTVARPVVIDEESGEVAARKMMALSLTFDHRLVDGAPAARFLQQVKRWVEQPYGWLTS